MMEGKMKILIGYDGSASADAALDDLRQAGLPDECAALVMSVAEVFLPPPPPSSYEILEMTESFAKSVGPHFTYEKELRAVEVGFSIRLERFLIGSVASAIASRAHCSVEVVREPTKVSEKSRDKTALVAS